MADFFAARVWEAGTITGTDPTYTLPGTAAIIFGDAAYRTFAASGITIGATFTATIVASTTGGAWEQSRWTYTAADTIQRLAFGSSSTGAIVNWSGVAARISIDVPLPVSVSAGSGNAGAIPALNAAGLLDSTLVSPSGFVYGPAVTGQQFQINDGVWSGNNSNQWPTGSIVRFAMAWKYAFSPKNLGVFVNTVVSGAECELGIYEMLSTGEAGTLLYDSGVISPQVSGSPAFGSNAFSAIFPPGTYIFDLLIGAASPDLYIELATATGGSAVKTGFFGGLGGNYYQYSVLVSINSSGGSIGSMPLSAPAWNTFSGENSFFNVGSRPIIIANV